MGNSNCIMAVVDQLKIDYKGRKISDERVIKALKDFLTQTIDNTEHNVGFVFHTGSICFDVVMMVYAAMACVMFDNRVIDEITSVLEPGDFVVYNNAGRQKYIGREVILGEERIKLEGMDGVITYVPKKMERFIAPYGGSSRTYGNRGIRNGNKKIRREFLCALLNCDETEIPDVINTSTVMVMQRDYANDLVENISIGFGDDKRISLLDIVTASFFTESEEYPFKGNTAKSEPNLKITSKISNARRLIKEKETNNNFGVIILGEEMIARGETEIPEVIKRKSTLFTYVAINMSSSYCEKVLEYDEQAEVFACTKEFLLPFQGDIIEDNKSTRELNKQINAIIDKTMDSVILNSNISWERYKDIKRKLRIIRLDDYESKQKDHFIITSYSLLKLFATAPFSMSSLESMIAEGSVENVISPGERITEIRDDVDSFTGTIKEYSTEILELINEEYHGLMVASPKEEKLKEILSNNCDAKIAIIVPKLFYAKLLEKTDYYNLMKRRNNLDIVTEKKFGNGSYDIIILVGDFEGKKINFFNTNASQKVITILYSYEEETYKYKVSKSNDAKAMYNKRAFFHVEMEDTEKTDTDTDVEELVNIDRQAEEYLRELREIEAYDSINCGARGTPSTTKLEVISSALFETGERAFFTKMYKAYVFDRDNASVEMISVDKLTEGDALIFMKNNDEARDIVDYAIDNLISEKRLNEKQIDEYRKSKYWKQVLADYMIGHEITATEMARKMIGDGVNVVPQTITNWLNEDSHIVGPKDIESIKQIAVFVGDEDLLNNADDYYLACQTIRSLRRRILKEIGHTMIGELSGEYIRESLFNKEIRERIVNLADVLVIDNISEVTGEIPINKVNRPLVI